MSLELNRLALSMFGNKLLNSAYKKEEIRRPAKQPYHQIDLLEEQLTFSTVQHLRLDARKLNTLMRVQICDRNSFYEDLLEQKKKDFKVSVIIFNVFDLSSLPVMVNAGFMYGECCIKSDQMAPYTEMAVKKFFDSVYAVKTPGQLSSIPNWFSHFRDHFSKFNAEKWE